MCEKSDPKLYTYCLEEEDIIFEFDQSLEYPRGAGSSVPRQYACLGHRIVDPSLQTLMEEVWDMHKHVPTC